VDAPSAVHALHRELSVAPVAHVFVCYGSVSWDAAMRVAEAEHLPAESVYVLALFRAEPRELPNGTHFYGMDARRYSEWARPFRIAKWYQGFLRDLARASVSEVVAYVPHPFEIPANDLVYASRHVMRRELLPDGMVNYIAAPVVPSAVRGKVRYAARVLLRIVAARTVGLGYRPLVSGTLTQVEHLEYDRAWADSVLGFRAPSCGLTLLPSSALKIEPEARTGTLFLDQELGELVDAELEKVMRREVAAHLGGADSPLYYKSHPRGTNRAAQLVARVKDVSERGRAEDLVGSLAVAKLVGFYSTPLLLAGAGVERVAFLPERGCPGIRKLELLDELERALIGSGAIVVRVS
jgi:hypothetical protein